ncbi:hypothetical protein ACQPYK_37745 [Streptosporangium sp. CA-135522]|uniref:hypothetical protein n=1 Tax=Streptosporangium sp. CA-135522 TaxID=3240072 RepID=UPI003D9481D8
MGNFLEYLFPDGDENGLMAMGGAHYGHADRLLEPLADGDGSCKAVAATNRGEDIAAFVKNFDHPEGPNRNLLDATRGMRVAGLGLELSAGIVLAHKAITLLQYGLVATALAEAVALGGIGGMSAPLIKQTGQRALDRVTNAAVEGVLG